MSNDLKALLLAVGALLILAVVVLVGWPQYRVWAQELRGEATLREARWDRQVRVEEAQAELEAARLDAQSEEVRAEGLARANEIIGESLAGEAGEAYLRYRWIEGLHDESTDVIYVPTEANLPILEATRGLQ